MFIASAVPDAQEQTAQHFLFVQQMSATSFAASRG
jgi:hypothetical protein